ncbi:hypothetical protein ZOD2009_16246 [Haladaptatus paucihalophilus DX253]|uniref:Uncharacterized protein n=1 Tax=Haladaptatus paucihalophilus DX253 TaxID=797209 RepID=E7QWR1_HALPU|nr:hypothetical protein ZOD2009_16246 [Haladaptatus paucihalophilus DX253]
MNAAWERNSVDIRVWYVNLFGECTRGFVHEAKPNVILTDVLVPIPTKVTFPAGEIEGNCDVVPF